MTTLTVRDQLTAMASRFAGALPEGVDPEQFRNDAITCLSTTPKLAECGTSFLGALMTCAQLGLRPGVLGQAYIVPYGNKAQLILGYKGLIDLAYRSPRVATITANIVREGEEIELVHGRRHPLRHVQQLTGKPGKPVGYYAIARLVNGDEIPAYMTREEVEEWRDKHAKPGAGPWRDHFDAMALKTCVRQLAKWLPKTTELERALFVDGGVRYDTTSSAPEISTHFDMEGEVVDE